MWTRGQLEPHFIKYVEGNIFFFTVLLPGKIIQEVCESPVEVVKSKEIESALQTVDLNEEGEATVEPAEAKLKREEQKPRRTSLMAFLRQMVSRLLPVQKADMPRSASKNKGPVSPVVWDIIVGGRHGIWVEHELCSEKIPFHLLTQMESLSLLQRYINLSLPPAKSFFNKERAGLGSWVSSIRS